MKNFIILVLMLTLASAANAQKAAAKTTFTSVYSNFTTDCKNYDGSNGSDGYSICRGPSGYKIRHYYAAAATIYNAELKGDDQSYSFPMLDLKFNDQKTKIEWRMANGNPFAMIMRIPTYAPAAGDEYFGAVNGEVLFIRGLKGFDFEAKVDAKAPNANAKARELADAEYAKIKGN